MRKLQALKIALLIIILAEEIKRARELKHVYGDSTGRNYSKSSPSIKCPI
ncbi:hypothetical protein [Macrococcoides caseolyticum]|nr:hypothetical protein [Macrococcus caseolyticus]